MRDDLKARALIDAVAAFFGTNVFDHAAGSTDEDPEEDMDGEAAQLEAHAARYLRVLAEGARKAATPRRGGGGGERRRSGGGGWCGEGGGGRPREGGGGLAAVFGGPVPVRTRRGGSLRRLLTPLDVFSFPPLDKQFGEYASAEERDGPDG